MRAPLLSLSIRREYDIVAVRSRARQFAELLHFDAQDRSRIATATSEIARNALLYGGGGKVEFSIVGTAPPQLEVAIIDAGPGMANVNMILNGAFKSTTGMGLGIVGARRLMDDFEITSSQSGTQVRMRKTLPAKAPLLSPQNLQEIAEKLSTLEPEDAAGELQLQNQELLRTLDELNQRQDEMAKLNRELEDTNRGVMALYSELDEKAVHLRQADEIKSRFLSHMSHELRTPLNSILALTRLLLNRTDGDLSGEQEKQVTFIRNSAQDLADLVNDLLDLAKVEAGRIDVKVTTFEVSELFGALRGMFRPLVREGVTLFIEEPAGIPPLESDESKVAQILRNFISNALKFTEHGEVRVSARFDTRTECVLFSVRDTGIGIALKDHETIFHEFTQVQNPVQERVRGTGLGLPLSRKLAELLGGNIHLTSELGKGSVFSAEIPRVYGHRAGAARQSVERLLVIDDEEISRYILRQYLEPQYSVIEASSGPEGLDQARQNAPLVIFLDLTMPETDGFTILAELKQKSETREIPVVIYTSRALDGDERQAFLSQAVGVLNKNNISRESVHAALSEALGKHEPSQPEAKNYV